MRWSLLVILLAVLFVAPVSEAQDPPLWADQQQRLYPSIPEGTDHTNMFGGMTVIRGDTAIVSASTTDLDGFERLGVVYVFQRSGTQWVETARIEPPVAQRKHSLYFGGTVAFDGTTLAIGATAGDPRPRRELLMSEAVYHDRSLYESTRDTRALFPSVFVYRLTAGDWVLEASLINPGPAVNDAYGHNLAVGGNSLAVGADDTYSAGQPYSGAVYTYQRIQGVWTLTGTLTSPQLQGWGHFGIGLDMDADGDTLAIGTLYELAVYVYKRVGRTWAFEDVLLYNAPDGGFVYGAAVAVSPSGTKIAAGSVYERTNGVQTGSADIFTFANGDWTLEQKVVPIGAGAGTHFGGYIDIDERSLIGSSVWQIYPAQGLAGGPYVFTKSNGVWRQQARLMIFESEGFQTPGPTGSIGNIAIDGGYALMSPYTASGMDSTAVVLKIPGVEIDTHSTGAGGLLPLPPVGGIRTLEEDTAEFGISLKTRPTSDVVVHLTSDGVVLLDNGGTPALALTLNFTRDNWDIQQLVTARAVTPQLEPLTSAVTAAIGANSAVEYGWVSPMPFNVTISSIEPFGLVAPVGGAMLAGHPVSYTWWPHPSAVRYTVKIKAIGSPTLKLKNPKAARVCTPTLCTFTPGFVLPAGNYKWRVIARDVTGSVLVKTPYETFTRP
jgi:hypothetical protein